MKVEEAKAIYRAKYWDAMRADELPAGVDYCVFDYAVNSGTGRAPKVLQRVLGSRVTGRMDDATVAAAGDREPRALVQAICDERMRFLQALKTWPVFGKGWSRRVGEVRAAALAMADKAAGRAIAASGDTRARQRRGADQRRGPQGHGRRRDRDRRRRRTAIGRERRGLDRHRHHRAVALAVAAGAWAFWRWRQKRQQEAAA